MKTTSVTVSIGRTINMGNFEFLKLEESMTVQIDGPPGEALDKAKDWLEEKVDRDAIILAKRIKARK